MDGPGPPAHHIDVDEETNLAVDSTAGAGVLSIRLSGAWTLRSGLPSADVIAREIATRKPSSLVFDVRELGARDSAFVTFLRHVDVKHVSRSPSHEHSLEEAR